MADGSVRANVKNTKLETVLIKVLKFAILLNGMLWIVLNAWEIDFSILLGNWDMPFKLIGHILSDVFVFSFFTKMVFRERIKTRFWKRCIFIYGIYGGLSSYNIFATAQPFVRPFVATFINGFAFTVGVVAVLFIASYFIYFCYKLFFGKSL